MHNCRVASEGPAEGKRFLAMALNAFLFCSQENNSDNKYLKGSVEGSTVDGLPDAGCIEVSITERSKSKNQRTGQPGEGSKEGGRQIRETMILETGSCQDTA